MLIPVSTRRSASETETETPIERQRFIEEREIDPFVTSSTCWFKTWTAGSAFTI